MRLPFGRGFLPRFPLGSRRNVVAVLVRLIAGVALAVAGFNTGAESAADDKPHTTWTQYLGGPDSTQYSALKQINKSNVKQLELAWTFPAG